MVNLYQGHTNYEPVLTALARQYYKLGKGTKSRRLKVSVYKYLSALGACLVDLVV